MYTLDLTARDRFDTHGALDVETTGFDGATDDLVAIGVGYYDGTGPADVKVFTRSSVRNDELALVSEAFAWLDRRDPEGLVTYNGAAFDLPFLEAKVASLDPEHMPPLEGQHVDLFTERKRLATQAIAKWPRLEECLDAYDLPIAETVWEGEPLTNKVFREQLGPRYLAAVQALEFGHVHSLESVIREYTATDIEASIALYEADVGRTYTPTYAD